MRILSVAQNPKRRLNTTSNNLCEKGLLPVLCEICMNDTLVINEMLDKIKIQKNTIEYLENQLIISQEKCNVKKTLNKYFNENQQKIYRKYTLPYSELQLDELPKPVDNIVKFITITFDPSKFKFISDRRFQREYILTVLGYFKNKKMIEKFFGCFELHTNGRVHAHVATKWIHSSFKLELMSYFTNDHDVENQKAIDIRDKLLHCSNYPKEDKKCCAFHYIMKAQTKDEDYDDNLFLNISS